jgi:hypothetical protein
MRAATLFKRLFQTELLGTIFLDAGLMLRIRPDRNSLVTISGGTKLAAILMEMVFRATRFEQKRVVR